MRLSEAMEKPGPTIRGTARRILARAAEVNPDPLDSVGITLLAYANVRGRLSDFLGPAGFDALMARSLAIAAISRSEFSELRLNQDGVVHGLREYAEGRPVKEVLEGLEDLVSQLMQLVATFIGEDLAMRLTTESGKEDSDISNYSISGETLQ